MDIPNLKKVVLEPKIYTIIVRSSKGHVLHLGVHFTLEEAYSAACKRMEMLSPHKYGEAIDIDMWNSMSIRQAITNVTENVSTGEQAQGIVVGDNPEIPAIIKDFLDQIDGQAKVIEPKKEEITLDQKTDDLRKAKNELMKKLISDGDIEQVEKVKGLLDSYARRYVLKQIQKNKS